MVKIAKEKDNVWYRITIFDFENVVKIENAYGNNGDIYWALRNGKNDLVVSKSDQDAYNVFNKLYDDIVNSTDAPKKNPSCEDFFNDPLFFDGEEKIYAGSVHRYDAEGFYDPVERSINYRTDDRDVRDFVTSLVQTDDGYAIRFKGSSDSLPRVRICLDGCAYGEFSQFYAQCYRRLISIAIEDPEEIRRINEEFDKLKSTKMDVKEKDKHQ